MLILKKILKYSNGHPPDFLDNSLVPHHFFLKVTLYSYQSDLSESEPSHILASAGSLQSLLRPHPS